MLKYRIRLRSGDGTTDSSERTRLYGAKVRKAVLILIASYFLFLSARMEWQSISLSKQIQSATVKQQELAARRQQLKNEINLLNQPQYLERIAREQLGLVRPDEVLVIHGDRINNY